MQSSVDDRKKTYTFTVEAAATVVVLADDGDSTAPKLSGWSSCTGTMTVTVQYSTSRLGQCQTKTFTDGGTVSVTSNGAKTVAFVSYDTSDTEGPCFRPSSFG